MIPSRLRQNEICPMHRSKWCCGRGGNKLASKRNSRHYEMIAPGVKRYEDGREVCSDSALKKRKDQLLKTKPVCEACGQIFSDYRDVDLAHVESKGSGSWKRQDAFSNLRLLHRDTNLACGSRNLIEYMKEVIAAGKKFPCEVQ